MEVQHFSTVRHNSEAIYVRIHTFFTKRDQQFFKMFVRKFQKKSIKLSYLTTTLQVVLGASLDLKNATIKYLSSL